MFKTVIGSKGGKEIPYKAIFTEIDRETRDIVEKFMKDIKVMTIDVKEKVEKIKTGMGKSWVSPGDF